MTSDGALWEVGLLLLIVSLNSCMRGAKIYVNIQDVFF